MKKRTKINLLISIGVVLIVSVAVLLLSLNAIVHHILTEKIDVAIEKADSLCIKYYSFDIDLRKGKLEFHDVVFQTDNIFNDSVRAYSSLKLSKVGLDGVDYFSLLVNREIDLKGITIDSVSYRGILDTKAMEARAATDDVNEETRKQFERLLKEAQKHLNRVTLERLTITNATAEIDALETGLHLSVDDLGLELYDLGYSLVDSIPFHFNDSVIKLNLHDFYMVMPDSLMNLQVNDLYTDIADKRLTIAGVRFATDRIANRDDIADGEYHEVSVDTIMLDSIALPDMRDKRSIVVGELRVVNCHYYGVVDGYPKTDKPKKKIDFAELGMKTEEAQMLAQLKQKQEELMTDQQVKMIGMVQNWLDEVKVDCISIENAVVNLSAYNNALNVDVDDINLSFNNLGYSLIDKIPYHFNDSLYSLSIGHMNVTTPDGLMAIASNGFSHSNCGPICVGRIEVKNTIDKWQLAHAMGDQTVTWVNLTLDTFFTSKVSPFSTVIDRKLLLDTVFVKVEDLQLFVDNRNLSMPKFEMPSKQTLLEIKRLFEINNILLKLGNLRTEVTGHYANNGIITAKDASVSLNDIYFNNLNVRDFDAIFPDGTLRLSIGDVHTSHSEHNLVVRDVEFSTDDGEGIAPAPYHRVRVDSIVVGGVMLDKAYTDKNLAASVLRIVHPQYTGRVLLEKDNKTAKAGGRLSKGDDPVAMKMKKIEKVQRANMLEFFQEWLDYAQMQRIRIEKADADIRAINSGFSLKTHDFNLSLSGIGFNIDNYIPISIEDSLIDIKYFMSNFRLIGNSAISNIGFKDLHATLPDSSMYLNVKKVHTDYASSSVVIDNVEFATDTVIPTDEMYHKVTIDTLRLDGIVLPDLRTQREATASALRVIRPHYFGYIDETPKDGKTKVDSVSSNTYNAEKHKKALRVMSEFFDGAALDKLSIEAASAEFYSLVSNLSGKADGIDLSLNNISYALSDVVYDVEQVPGLSFNDSVYSVKVSHADILIPDSTMFISMNNFKHENCGPVSVGRTAMNHTIDRWAIAHRNGDIPTTWFSMVLDTFRTSFVRPMNIFRNYQAKGNVNLDSMFAVVDTLTIFRDMRYKPKEPYRMPQAPVLQMDSSKVSMFTIRSIDAQVNRMNVSMAMSDHSVPFIGLDDIWGKVNNVSLARGSDINIVGGASIGGGTALLNANIGIKRDCPWDVSLQAKGVDLGFLNDLVYPIAGMNVSGTIRELQAEYGGDSVKAEGVMKMEYNDLRAVFYNESPSPYKFIGKNYKFLNSAARTLISHDNPSKRGAKARAYKVSWKNDPWNPAAMFMLGPVIKGAIETLLPGLFVHDRVNVRQK